VLLEGKAILQELCPQDNSWDDPVPVEIQKRWLKWKSEIILETLLEQNFIISLTQAFKATDNATTSD